ncbi:MAG: hypothetical protein IJN05_08520 [Ruminococcus sp.]|nr:hypothetical protein [Ruminococcus sp.]
MLNITEISEIIKKIDSLYSAYKNSYAKLKNEVFLCGTSVKYSSGGIVYPFGKYFFGRSKIFKKAAKQTSGHFCKDIDEANFAYVFSESGQLLAINQMFDYTKNSDGYVYYTSFLEYDTEKIHILKYRENSEVPVLCGIGIVYSRDNNEIIVSSDAPCKFVTIVIIDNENNNEYLYYINRELFATEYNLTSTEIYSDFSKLF